MVDVPSDALVFVPGLGDSDAVRVAHVTELLCWEMNQQAPDRTTTFAATPTSVGTEVVHRIVRTEGDGTSVPVLDVYAYDSRAAAGPTISTSNPLAKVLTLALTMISAIVVLVTVALDWRRKAKRRTQLLQVIAVAVLVLCIVAYFAIAVVALVEAIVTLARGSAPAPTINWPQWIVLIGAVVGGLVPALREKITNVGERVVQMARFTYTGSLRNRLTGGLQDLIDRIAQRSEIEHIHVVSYSFGSLIALDTIFPHGGQPARSMTMVDTLVTIGSPFDLIRMVRPNYPEERTLRSDVSPHWLNVYQPIDVLGSDFRDEGRRGEAVGLHGSTPVQRIPDENVAWNPDLQLNLVNLLMLRSLSVHAGYWDDAATARSAFEMVIRAIATRPILSAQTGRRRPAGVVRATRRGIDRRRAETPDAAADPPDRART